MPETLDPSSYIETLRWWRENYSDALMFHNTSSGFTRSPAPFGSTGSTTSAQLQVAIPQFVRSQQTAATQTNGLLSCTRTSRTATNETHIAGAEKSRSLSCEEIPWQHATTNNLAVAAGLQNRVELLKDRMMCCNCLRQHRRECVRQDPCSQCNREGHHRAVCIDNPTVVIDTISSGRNTTAEAPSAMETRRSSPSGHQADYKISKVTYSASSSGAFDSQLHPSCGTKGIHRKPSSGASYTSTRPP
ncbi:unnamed protein product [Heligmosomoides polygyrus]|uniref:Zn(2)-C6 fungal-type domain-containing protein n=1 Tax=Heligmosomoides polygyrus TaxID=6339 RepID=A0A183GLU4_HELPZ|nr:unnamed protein product [Heligmosomoides polygyrus]